MYVDAVCRDRSASLAYDDSARSGPRSLRDPLETATPPPDALILPRDAGKSKRGSDRSTHLVYIKGRGRDPPTSWFEGEEAVRRAVASMLLFPRLLALSSARRALPHQHARLLYRQSISAKQDSPFASTSYSGFPLKSRPAFRSRCKSLTPFSPPLLPLGGPTLSIVQQVPLPAVPASGQAHWIRTRSCESLPPSRLANGRRLPALATHPRLTVATRLTVPRLIPPDLALPFPRKTAGQLAGGHQLLPQIDPQIDSHPRSTFRAELKGKRPFRTVLWPPPFPPSID